MSVTCLDNAFNLLHYVYSFMNSILIFFLIFLKITSFVFHVIKRAVLCNSNGFGSLTVLSLFLVLQIKILVSAYLLLY